MCPIMCVADLRNTGLTHLPPRTRALRLRKLLRNARDFLEAEVDAGTIMGGRPWEVRAGDRHTTDTAQHSSAQHRTTQQRIVSGLF